MGVPSADFSSSLFKTEVVLVKGRKPECCEAVVCWLHFGCFGCKEMEEFWSPWRCRDRGALGESKILVRSLDFSLWGFFLCYDGPDSSSYIVVFISLLGVFFGFLGFCSFSFDLQCVSFVWTSYPLYLHFSIVLIKFASFKKEKSKKCLQPYLNLKDSSNKFQKCRVCSENTFWKPDKLFR